MQATTITPYFLASGGSTKLLLAVAKPCVRIFRLFGIS
jgi:hypothetical protein